MHVARMMMWCFCMLNRHSSLLESLFVIFHLPTDNGINLPEYIAINRQEQLKHEDGELSDLDLVRMRMQFQSMDLDGDGTVDYWEFIKYETTKSLARRDKVYIDG